ncbi:MAG: type II secretion system protein M [Gammaproteobacteria bacterium]|nr:type II secretion system protein M [Gammaproteobacteria bacterium]
MIHEYWQQRTARERVLLAVMGILIGLLLIYSLIIEPVMQSRAELEDVVARSRDTYSSIRSASAEARKLRGGGATSGSSRREAQSLIGQIEQSARAKGLADKLQRIQPSGKTDIGIWFEKSRFDTLLAWLSEMEQQYGLQVKTLEIERTESGIVNARVVLGS